MMTRGARGARGPGLSLALIASALCLLLTASPAAARARLVASKKLELEQRTTQPTFTPARLRVMDRGKLVYLGKGMWAEQERFVLRSLPDGKLLEVKAPLAAYVAQNPELRKDPTDRRPLHKQLHVTKLLYYDRTNREAGFELVDQVSSRGVRRHFLVQWDLQRNVVNHVTLVARSQPGRSYTHSLPLGYDPARREFYYVRQVIRSGRDARDVFVIGFSASGKPRVVAQFVGGRSMRSNTYFDPKTRRAVLVEYAELASKGPAPMGHLVHTDSGKMLHFPIPLTAYGVAFAPDGQNLYVYSSQLGELWQIDAAGQRKVRLKVGKLGHELGFYRGQLVLLRNSGLRLFSQGRRGLRKGSYLPLKQLYAGFSHVEGSRVLPEQLLIRNGSDLYFAKIEGASKRRAVRKRRKR